jgi:hypothetical protein
MFKLFKFYIFIKRAFEMRKGVKHFKFLLVHEKYAGLMFLKVVDVNKTFERSREERDLYGVV